MPSERTPDTSPVAGSGAGLEGRCPRVLPDSVGTSEVRATATRCTCDTKSVPGTSSIVKKTGSVSEMTSS